MVKVVLMTRLALLSSYSGLIGFSSYQSYHCTLGPSIKDVRREGGGRGVAQKRTNADKGGGGSRQSGRPQQKKIIFNYLIVASLNEVLNRN